MNDCIVTGKDLMEALGQCEDERRTWKQHCESQEKRIKTYQEGIKGLTQRILDLEKDNKSLRRQLRGRQPKVPTVGKLARRRRLYKNSTPAQHRKAAREYGAD